MKKLTLRKKMQSAGFKDINNETKQILLDKIKTDFINYTAIYHQDKNPSITNKSKIADIYIVKNTINTRQSQRQSTIKNENLIAYNFLIDPEGLDIITEDLLSYFDPKEISYLESFRQSVSQTVRASFRREHHITDSDFQCLFKLRKDLENYKTDGTNGTGRPDTLAHIEILNNEKHINKFIDLLNNLLFAGSNEKIESITVMETPLITLDSNMDSQRAPMLDLKLKNLHELEKRTQDKIEGLKAKNVGLQTNVDLKAQQINNLVRQTKDELAERLKAENAYALLKVEGPQTHGASLMKKVDTQNQTELELRHKIKLEQKAQKNIENELIKLKQQILELKKQKEQNARNEKNRAIFFESERQRYARFHNNDNDNNETGTNNAIASTSASANASASASASANASARASRKIRLKYTESNRKHNRSYFRTCKTMTNFFDDALGIINTNEVEIKKILSENFATGSGAKVILIKEKNPPKKSYIVKQYDMYEIKTKFSNNTNEINIIVKNISKEQDIYMLIMKTLVKNNITPYLISGVTVKNYYYTEINPNTRKPYLKTSFLINETASCDDTNGDDTNVMSLNNFLKTYMSSPLLTKEIMLNILFQIIYTLTCFNAIKFKHNDLHLSNILIFIRKENILEGNLSVDSINSSKKFILEGKVGTPTERCFRLRNIGLDVRIFDFDKSSKLQSQSKITKLNETYKCNEINYYGEKINNDNPYFDSFKVIGSLYLKIYFYYGKDKLLTGDFNKNQSLVYILPILLNYLTVDEHISVSNYKKNVIAKPLDIEQKRKIEIHSKIFIKGYYEDIKRRTIEFVSSKFINKDGNNLFLSRNYDIYIPTKESREMLLPEEYLEDIMEYIKFYDNDYDQLQTHEPTETFNFTDVLPQPQPHPEPHPEPQPEP